MEVTPADFITLRECCDVFDALAIPYVIGGGTVVVLYGRNRRTKDFDIFLNRAALERAMTGLVHADFTTSDTEKKWLFKAWRGETLIDLIVESRGGIRIDREVMRRSRIVNQYGYHFRVMGLEDTFFRKVLTLTEGRPDWYDALSILERQRGELDWEYVLARAGSRYARRMLAFLCFAQTELHVPPGHHRATPDELYSGNDPGPVPEWVVRRLMQQLLRGDIAQPVRPPAPALEYRRAA